MRMINSDTILLAMIEKAKKLGIQKGAAIVYGNIFYQTLNFAPVEITGKDQGYYSYFRPPDHINRGSNDQGTNYLAYAAGKLFHSFRTFKDSGSKDVLKGESAAKGSIILGQFPNCVIFAFSGGTEEQDLQVARAGYRAYDWLKNHPPSMIRVGLLLLFNPDARKNSDFYYFNGAVISVYEARGLGLID